MRLPTSENDNKLAYDGGAAIERDVDFSDYMWMGEEMEEFDSKCLLELYEEDFIESCFEELFEEEELFAEEMELYLAQLTPDQVGNLVRQLDAMSIVEAQDKDELAMLTSLNPEAPVFVPSSSRHPALVAMAAAATAGSDVEDDDDCPK